MGIDADGLNGWIASTGPGDVFQNWFRGDERCAGVGHWRSLFDRSISPKGARRQTRIGDTCHQGPRSPSFHRRPAGL